MEENISDTEFISNYLCLIYPSVAAKRQEKFQQRVVTLRTLILILLAFGTGLCKSLLF